MVVVVVVVVAVNSFPSVGHNACHIFTDMWQASCHTEPAGHPGTHTGCNTWLQGQTFMLDRATTLNKDVFTAIMLVTVMQFDTLHSFANIRNIFRDMMAFLQQHICITMHMQVLFLQ